MNNDLEQRIEQYQLFELPGQPMAAHMGTSYLINDLWKEVRKLQAELDALKSLRASEFARIRDVRYITRRFDEFDTTTKVASDDPRYDYFAGGYKTALSIVESALTTGDTK